MCVSVVRALTTATWRCVPDTVATKCSGTGVASSVSSVVSCSSTLSTSTRAVTLASTAADITPRRSDRAVAPATKYVHCGHKTHQTFLS